MKWRLQLIYNVFSFSQIAGLFLFWRYHLLEHKYYQWILALVIFAVGIFSGFIRSKINNTQKYTENRRIELTIMLMSAIFAAIAAYIIFFPFIYLLSNNIIVALLIVFGVAAPSAYNFIEQRID